MLELTLTINEILLSFQRLNNTKKRRYVILSPALFLNPSETNAFLKSELRLYE